MTRRCGLLLQTEWRGLPVCQSVTLVSPAKMAELIEMPFGGVDSGEPKEACVRWDAHWRHLANTTEPSMYGGDAA